VPWLLALLVAASSVHRAKAERAEAVGHMLEAAREYEAAYEDDHAPELLFRLGVVRRKLKQYAKAREAFRAYLRVAPEGGLRQDVERQLVKLDVLMEAQTEDYSEEPRKGPVRRAPALVPGEQRSPAPSEQVNAVHQPQPEVQGPPPLPPAPAAALPPPAGERRSPALSEQVNNVHQSPPQPFGRRVAPFLAAGAVTTFAAGGYLWWDGNRLSHDLDSRYTSGDLTGADQSLYGRAHGASLAGRALVLSGALLTAGAVVLWW
jgi:tetratricopeptide (TPR) repeat protein